MTFRILKTEDQLNAALLGTAILAFKFNGDGVGAPGRIILHYTGALGCDATYMVHWQNRRDGGCCSGGYHHSDLGEAMDDFAQRVKREQGYCKVRGDTGLLITY